MYYPTYMETFESKSPLKDFPLGDDFNKKYTGMSRSEIWNIQNEGFKRCLKRAWEFPFYQRHWGQAGIEKSDIKDLNDISKLPPYSKDDSMKSVANFPPLGDFHGWDVGQDCSQLPMIFHTTSVTTGRPQPLFFFT